MLKNYRVQYRDGTVQHYQLDDADAAALAAQAEGDDPARTVYSVTQADPEPIAGPVGDFE